MLQDIKDRNDLEVLFANFYELAMKDALIGRFFTEIVPIDIKEHLPHILDFWEANLWGKIGYKKNLLKIHLDIDKKSKLESSHFDQWVKILNECVDKKFKGSSADRLKTNALSIATVMKIKVV